MAYYRSYKQLTSYQRRKHGMRGAKPSNRRPKRRYTRKRRSRRPMSKRAVLNTTSRKKRNGMLGWSNTTSSGSPQALQPSPTYVSSVGGFFVYCATAQQLDAQSTIANQATRTATTCYMKGLSEHLRIQTSTGVPWFHRRVCFTLKGRTAFNTQLAEAVSPPIPYGPFVDTSSGIERIWLNQTTNSQPVTTAGQWDILFKGTVNVDWNDYIIAPLDTSRVSVKFDKTWTLQSGNSNGVVRERKLWHAMGHNIVYDDDESGDVQQASYYSVDSKAGMGDYYVVDMFQPGAGASSPDVLRISSNSTLYWHER